jgi:glycosyltransferase involved in cell wall biosynthesis
MSAGTPVIAFAVGGMPEAVVDGQTGKLISRGRINGLAEAILSVLANLEAWSNLEKTAGKRSSARILERCRLLAA